MYNYQIIKRHILDEVKPNLCNVFLIINDIKLLPKEVNWIIINKLLDVNEHIINYDHDVKLFLFQDIMIIDQIKFINKEEIPFEKYINTNVANKIRYLNLEILNNLTGNTTLIPEEMTFKDEDLNKISYSEELVSYIYEIISQDSILHRILCQIKNSTIINNTVKNKLKLDERFLINA